ncbi:arylesterase [Acidihalobacter yilgarnensis]|uniref:Arylesterase n=1 Tax=Acidihalobacter yilgarnensis TaxID=2819280 RepID=A0A1D8IN73_9GAMM|nr:arylesterase [Acidihalobacter yilgarnensis]AOU97875.1 arylesterase [Acidihalobacter yilgarnensis]
MRATLIRCLLIVLLATGPAAAAAKAPIILILGDSLSAAHGIPVDAGWVHLLAARLFQEGYPDRVVNASIGGDTTAGGLARLPAELARYHPSLVVIELGGNDGLRGTPIATFRAQLEQLVATAQRGGARVLLLGVRMPPNYGPAYTQMFHRVYEAVARQTHTPLVPFLLKGVATDPALMQADGIHPTAAAQPQLLDNVWPSLRPLLRR